MTDAALAEDDARRLRECLADGGVAVVPTDTVYGLACDPESRTAVERLYGLKGRPADRPAAVMFFTLAPALRSLPALKTAEREAIEALLPGPVTVLLVNREHRFELACRPDPETLGLRVPRLGTATGALAALSAPLLQSSANLSGEGEVRRLADLHPSLLERADLILDAGELPGTASTVLDLRTFADTGAWNVVRDGALEIEAIRRALG
jgi:L-threonylcarbamoyladenylate synthase